MRIFVLGANGMLGRYVSAFFKSEGYDVVNITRKHLDLWQISVNYVRSFLRWYQARPKDVVINCIGIIKQRKDFTKVDFVRVNSLFPHLLWDACYINGVRLIHITTDCVFDGLDGNYDENSTHNAEDVYGMSKSLGEPERATVIRTSIIGEEINQNRSLVEWIKSNRDKQANGYINHFWNGVTCLEFAKICKRMINEDIFWQGTKHIFSPGAISKYELVKMISDIYELNIDVIPFETAVKCDRTLSSIRTDVVIDVPELKDQIIEMKNFYGKLNIPEITDQIEQL